MIFALLHIHRLIHILSYLALFTQTFLKFIIAIGKNSNPFHKIVYSRFLSFSKRWIIELFPTMTVYNGNPKNLVVFQSMKPWQKQVKEKKSLVFSLFREQPYIMEMKSRQQVSATIRKQRGMDARQYSDHFLHLIQFRILAHEWFPPTLTIKMGVLISMYKHNQDKPIKHPRGSSPNWF